MNKKIIGTISNEKNPRWPPKINTIIVAEHPNYKNNLFVGSVYKLLSDYSGAIILLLNNQNYVETILEQKKIVPQNASKGLFLLLPMNGWRYVNVNKYKKIFDGNNQKNLDKINQDIKIKYQNMLKNIGPVVQSDLTTEAVYADPSMEKGEKCGMFDDDFKDTSLLNEKGELQLDNLFTEKENDRSMFNPNEKFHTIGDKFKKALLLKLNSGESIPEENSKIIVNKSVAIKNIIETKDDEINEGNKIIKWITNNLINKKTDNINIFGDIKMSIFNGYVYFSRMGIRITDTITRDLVPNLKYFRWQYNIPIDYDTLKYTLFQNDFQEKIKSNMDQQKEAELIFSQEYLIALQPEPKYQIWVLTRLIMMWHADDYLQYNIRKIKVIVNQWRCRGDKEFNKKFGVLPSIVVYPRYGKNSARNVLAKISSYFTLYQTIGWKCATPSYFVKINDLIWYTNGSIDLKLYFRKSMGAYEGKVLNKSFNESYTGMASAENLLYPYNDKKQQDEIIDEKQD